jgi:hypothetical protein
MTAPAMIREAWAFAGDNASTIIAFCALGLTIYQACVVRRHNRLSVRPLLTTFTEQVSGADARITYSLMNNGLGPALIDSFEVNLDGAVVNLQATEQINEKLTRLLEQRPRDFSVGHLNPGSTLRKDEIRQMFDVRFSAMSPAQFEGLANRLNRIRLIVKYHSLYDKPYVLDTEKNG